MDPQDWLIVSLSVGNFLLNTWSKKEHVADLGRVVAKKTAEFIQWTNKKK